MKPTIIYLMGAAYSGSTILGAIFGEHSDIEDIGEISFWTIKTTELSARTCSCGKPVSDCEFWSKVRASWLAKCGEEAPTVYRALQLKYEHNDFSQFFWRLRGAANDPKFQEYARLTRAQIESIVEVSGKSYLMDTSKSPGRALALSKVEGIDLVYIHLVRGGLPFILSSLKRNFGRRKKKITNQPYLIFRFSLKWLFTNLGAELVARLAKRPTAKIFYERLMRDPESTLAKAGAALGIDLSEVASRVATGNPIDFRHCIDGSKIRWGGPTPLRLSPDSDKPMPAWTKLIFNFTAGWLSKIYGY